MNEIAEIALSHCEREAADNLQRIASNLREQTCACRTEIDRLGACLAERDAEMVRLRAELESSHLELTARRTAIAREHADAVKRLEQLQAMERDRDGWRAMAGEALGDVERMRERLSAMTRARDAAMVDVARDDGEIVRLSRRAENAEADANAYRHAWSAATNRLRCLRAAALKVWGTFLPSVPIESAATAETLCDEWRELAMTLLKDSPVTAGNGATGEKYHMGIVEYRESEESPQNARTEAVSASGYQAERVVPWRYEETVATPPARQSGTVAVKLEYAGRGSPPGDWPDVYEVDDATGTIRSRDDVQ